MVSDDAAALAVTAQFTAAARARESERPDALFSDPWATRLAGEEGFAWLEKLGPASALWPVVRTRFLDDLLREDPPRQVVILAAGLDTRAYRLPWAPEICLFELDQTRVLERKHRVLREAGAVAHCRRTAIAADFGYRGRHTGGCWIQNGPAHPVDRGRVPDVPGWRYGRAFHADSLTDRCDRKPPRARSTQALHSRPRWPIPGNGSAASGGRQTSMSCPR